MFIAELSVKKDFWKSESEIRRKFDKWNLLQTAIEVSIGQNKIKRCSLFTCRALSSFHHTDLVVMVPVFARQESQVYQEALDPRDRQALRVHQARKDPRDHVETEARQGNQEIKGFRAPRDLQGH